MKTTNAWQLKKNQRGIVSKIQPTVNPRVIALCILPGNLIICKQRWGSGGVYAVQNLRVYLSKEDAAGVMLR